jgi:hypothetical protein
MKYAGVLIILGSSLAGAGFAVLGRTRLAPCIDREYWL